MDKIVIEATEIDLHHNKINKEDGFSLSRPWKPIYSHTERTRRKFSPIARLPLDPAFLSGPLKQTLFLFLYPDPALSTGSLKRVLSYLPGHGSIFPPHHIALIGQCSWPNPSPNTI
jgi:hypothetical protein